MTTLTDREPVSGGQPTGEAAGQDRELAPVCAGVYAERIPVVGMSVGAIRRTYADALEIDPDTEAVIDGRAVGDDEVIRSGQTLLFAHRSGEIGVR